MDAISATKSFLESLNSVEKDWSNWVDEAKQCDLETQDLLHEIELTKFDIQRGYKLCKKLKEIRKRRRDMKNKMELLSTLKDFSDRNQQLKINLYKALTAMEKTEDHQSKRVYGPRVLTDITLIERGHVDE